MTGVPPLSMRQAAQDPEGFARAMGESYARYGFAIVSDHGLEPALIARALARVKAFFALPQGIFRLAPGLKVGE